MDDFLNNKLSELDQKNGFGGQYSFQIEGENEKGNVLLVGVNDLTEQAARILFDQFDEHNYLGNLQEAKLKISLLKEGIMIDYNYLPNAFTK